MLTTEEAATVLDRHPQTLKNWRQSETTVSPRWVKVGGRIYYPAKDLAGYVERAGIADEGREYIENKLNTREGK